jgi:hypothetical protein
VIDLDVQGTLFSDKKGKISFAVQSFEQQRPLREKKVKVKLIPCNCPINTLSEEPISKSTALRGEFKGKYPYLCQVKGHRLKWLTKEERK